MMDEMLPYTSSITTTLQQDSIGDQYIDAMISSSRYNTWFGLFAVLLGRLCSQIALRSRCTHSFQPAVNNYHAKSSVEERCPSCRRSIEPSKTGFATAFCMTSSNSEVENVLIPFYGSENRFDRWRFLQEFLEGDHPSSDVVNVILYRVLDGALKYPRPSGGGDAQSGGDTIEMKRNVREKIQVILSDFSNDGRVKAVPTMSNKDDGDAYEKDLEHALDILEQIERVLPDPVEDEDDFKSLWDSIIELHGREAVKINETQNPVSVDWKIANTVARVLLHFDFLTLGIIDAPIL